MPIDPLSAVVNAVGLAMQQNATGRAADAAANNMAFQKAGMSANIGQQYADTNHMLGINDQIQEFLRGSGNDLDALIDAIVKNQNDMVSASADTRNAAARNKAAERDTLATIFGNQDISTAREGVAKTEKAAMGDRVDAYGNRVTYNPTTGEWNTRLSDNQSDIARQSEQAETGRLAALNEAIAGQRFDKSRSEGDIRSELTGLMTDADATNARERASIIGRQALRMGKGASLAEIMKASDDALGEKAPRTLLDARNQAASEAIGRANAKNQQYLTPISTLSSATQEPASLKALSGTRDNAIDKLISTLVGNQTYMSNVTTGAENRIMDSKNRGIQDILGMLEGTEKERLATATSGNALRLSNENASIQRVIDALTARSDIFKGNADRINTAITSGATAANTASGANVKAIGAQAPDPKILAGLSSSLSMKEGKSGGSGYGNSSSQDIIDDLVSKMSADMPF